MSTIKKRLIDKFDFSVKIKRIFTIFLYITYFGATVETLSENVSKTLDNKYGDKLPIQEIAEKLFEPIGKIFI